MPKYEIDHIHLTSPDPAKTAGFYEKLLDAKIVGEGVMPDGRKNVNIDINGLIIRITELSSATGDLEQQSNGLNHIGFRTNDIEGSMAELKAEGAMVVKDIGPMRAGKMSFFMAPDNVLVELIEPGK
jgi:catechol 2,3-dioxygenase-like lactoylglutathione lyase family enzyme